MAANTNFLENGVDLAAKYTTKEYVAENYSYLNLPFQQNVPVLYSWGDNTYGQIGVFNLAHRSSPVQTGAVGGMTKVAIGDASLSVNKAGQLFASGINTHGQLGLNDIINRSSPVQVGTSSWRTVSLGNNHAAGLVGNLAYAWGMNSSGQLAQSADNIHRSAPVQITAKVLSNDATSLSSFAGISAGGDNLALITSGGYLYTYGSGNAGQLISGSFLNSWTSVSAGASTAAAIRSDGALYMWGANDFGQLGQNNLEHRSSPVQLGTGSWSSVSVSDSIVAAINSLGGLFVWGDNNNGQLGLSDAINRSSPVQVGTSSWVAVSVGPSHISAIRAVDRALFTWGLNSSGQLGSLNLTHRSSPVQVGTSSWSKVASGPLHTIALRLDGGLFTWGQNNVGQLGNSTVLARSSPVQVGTSSWTVISSKGNTVAAIRAVDSGLFLWGDNTYGQLGALTVAHRSSPVQLGTSSWSFVATGGPTGSYVIAQNFSTKQLYSWGRNDSYQLGYNAIAGPAAANALFTWGYSLSSSDLSGIPHRSSPVQVGANWDNSLSIQTAVRKVGWKFSSDSGYFVIDTNSKLWARGMQPAPSGAQPVSPGNTYQYFELPVQVGSSSWTSVSSSGYFTLAIRSDGAMFGWGSNPDDVPVLYGTANTLYGPLYTWGTAVANDNGYFLLTNLSSPVQIDDAVYFGQLATKGRSVINFFNKKQLYTWGDNTYGQLGNSTTTQNRYPRVLLNSAKSWTMVTGNQTRLAVAGDGSLFTWGRNDNGQLGQGDTIHRSSPVQVGTSSWTMVADGGYAIRTDGGLFTWGFGLFGNRGLTDNINYSSPVQIGTSSWISVASDESLSTTLAIRQDGALFAWGYNTGGANGLDDTVSRSSPVQVGTSSWTMISVSGQNSAAIRSDGALFVWGLSSDGALGLNDSISRSSPVQVGTSSWTAVNVFVNGTTVSTLAIRQDGTLWTWGNNTDGGLALNDTVHRSSPVQIGVATNWKTIGTRSAIGYVRATPTSSPIQIGTSSWTSVDARAGYFGRPSLYAIRSDGALFSWGKNDYGQLGLGDNVHRSSPVQVGTSSWVAVKGTLNGFRGYALAIRATDRKLFAWGANELGQLGIDNIFNRSSPVQVGTSSWASITAGEAMSAAIRIDGALFAWGDNSFGQLGLSDRLHRSSPIQVGTSSWSQVAGGSSAVAAIRLGGNLFTWGQNNAGVLGLGDSLNRSSPVQVGTDSWSMVATNGSTTVGFKTATQDYFIDNTSSSSPVQIGTLIYANAVFDTGKNFAVLTTPDAYTHGDNTYGQLGLKTTVLKSNPTLITTNNALYATTSDGKYLWNSVSVGSNNMMGITSDSYMYSWGDNTGGKLGINLNSTEAPSRSAAIQIGNPAEGAKWMSVSRASNHNLAIKSDGTLWGWGANDKGQLGSNDLVNRSSPFQINSGVWKEAAASDLGASYAIDSSGKLWSWGANDIGQLGHIDQIHRSSPTQVGSLLTWRSVKAGTSHALAVDTSGVLYSWGDNSSGQLGLAKTKNRVYLIGDLLPRSSPTQVGTSWNIIDASGDTSGGINFNGEIFGWGSNANWLIPNKSLSTPWLHLKTDLPANDSPPVATGTFIYVGNSARLYNTYKSVGAIKVDGSLWVSNNAHQSPLQQIGTSSWVAVTTNSWNTYAIRTDGALFAWGDNSFGQLGLSDRLHRSSPVQIGTDSWVSVTSASRGLNNGYVHGVTSDGRLFAWGYNNNKQLGLGDTVHRSSPTQVGSLTNWIKVEASVVYSDIAFPSGEVVAALNNKDELYAWGYNSTGALGQNDTIHRSSPVQVFAGAKDFQVIDDSLFIWNANNDVYVTGRNNDGRLGLGDNLNRSTPTALPTVLRPTLYPNDPGKWRVFSQESDYLYGIDSQGWRWFMGGTIQNPFGNPTIGFSTSLNTPQIIKHKEDVAPRYSAGNVYGPNIKQFAHFSGNSTTTYINSTFLPSAGAAVGTGYRVAANNIYVWNGTSYDDIGPKQITQWNMEYREMPWFGYSGEVIRYQGKPRIGMSPTQLMSGTGWKKLSLGRSHVVAISSNNTLWTWGNNENGQLGNGDGLLPRLFQWGPGALAVSNNVGQLYLPPDDTTPTAKWVYDTMVIQNQPTGLSWTKIDSHVEARTTFSSYDVFDLKGWLFAAIRSDGALFFKGPQFPQTQLANTSDPAARWNQLGTSSWTAVSVNVSHVAAIRSDGGLFTWGYNASGQLGNDAYNHRSSPVQVGTSSWIAVAAGVNSTYAIRADGGLFVWGNPGYAGPYVSPVQIGASSWSSVSAGWSVVTAIRSDNTLWAWGKNASVAGSISSGTAGEEYAITFSSPVQIGTKVGHPGYPTPLSNWSMVSVSKRDPAIVGSDSGGHITALTSTGQLYIGGSTTRGQHGVYAANASTGSWSLVPATAGTSWTFVTTTDYGTLAINSNKDLLGWGLYKLENQYQFNGATSSPVQVGSLPTDDYIRGDDYTVQALNVTQYIVPIPPFGSYDKWINATAGLAIGYTTSNRISRSSPVQVGSVSAVVSRAVVYNSDSSYLSAIAFKNSTSAVRTDNKLYAWGEEVVTSTSSYTSKRSSPVQVGTNTWSAASPIFAGGVAIDLDSRLYMWGNNTSGQLGQSDTISRSSAVQISGNSTWSKSYAGKNSSAAISQNGYLYVWGNNSSGQLGQGDLVHRSSPTQVGSERWAEVVEIDNGTTSSFIAVRIDGTLWGWGDNAKGQLGLSDRIHRSSPVQINSGFGWRSVSGGKGTSAALLDNGDVY